MTAFATGRTLAAASLAAALAFAPAAFAQDFENQVGARQGQFKVMAVNLGVLGGMARGQMEYDAETAQAAADNIVTVTSLHQDFFWPEGSDNVMLDITRAEPSIWEDNADFLSKWSDTGEAAVALQEVAADGQEGLGTAVGELGGTCKACHDAHRGPELN
jgi:cytochrome c556